MKYSVEIVRNADKKAVLYSVGGGDWNGESSESFWTDGNFGCDCNRYLCFERALGTPEENLTNAVCGETAYTVTKAILEDGTEIPIDPPAC